MTGVSQNTKYVKLDDGVSFSLVRTNPKLTTNTKLMYNGKKMYMESYASGELLNRISYKNVSVKSSGLFNMDIANFLTGSGSQAYSVYQNFSDISISDNYDNQFETFYWCGAEYINSNFYTEEIGFVAPLYLREKLPNYFVIFRLDTPSNYNLTVDQDKMTKDSIFDFKTDILDKAVLIKTFDLREGTVLGNYIHNYIDQDRFEFDKSMYVNFSNAEVTYYGIDKNSGILEKRVESFNNELLRVDNPVLKNDKWFTEGFERNGLIFPYIMNIEYLFDDDNFNKDGEELYDFARYIGVYCNNIEFGEFDSLDELINSGYTEDNAIYYFEDNKKNLHRYTNNEKGFKIDGKDAEDFNMKLISGFESDRITGYAEPLDVDEGFINRAQYGFEILKPLEPGDWVGIEYNGYVECYFADDKNISAGVKKDMLIGEYSDFRFSVSENSTVNDIAESLAKSVNKNKKSKFEAKYSDNIVAFYAKREGKEYNGSETGGAKMLMEASLIYNRKISMPISNHLTHVDGYVNPIENISGSDYVIPVDGMQSSFGNYYKDYFCGACDADIDSKTDTYKNIFKIYIDEYAFFDMDRYLKTNNGDGRQICANMIYINLEGKVDPEYRLVIVDDAPLGKEGNIGYDVSVSSTCQVEVLDKLKSNYGILSWFPVKDFDFDINYSTYGQYIAFTDECNTLSEKVIYESSDISGELTGKFKSGVENEIKKLAKSHFSDDFGNNLESEYDYYLEQFHSDLCLMSKSVPYISKWGYYDDQKDSCENPYRLNINKVFGVSNLSANTYLKNCDETECTHSMPYYMTLHSNDYLKNYQYIESDEIYKLHNSNITNLENQYIVFDNNGEENIKLETNDDCVNYWINKFMDTDVDMFSHFFSGKKYGKRFDKKYSRLLGGDKLHNPSTLFRGVKFEAIRQYGGLDKKSVEYNDYKFSFVYIPIMINSMVFDDRVYFVKNDTFKFIVGIVFVNTMLGAYGHDIFNGNIDYFNKGFIYAACKDIIRPMGLDRYSYKLVYNDDREISIGDTKKDFWKNKLNDIFYMWSGSNQNVIVTKTSVVKNKEDIIGEFKREYSDSNFNETDDGISKGIQNIKSFSKTIESFDEENNSQKLKYVWSEYFSNYDTTIYRYDEYESLGTIKCQLDSAFMEIRNNIFVDVCNVEWEYFDENYFGGYVVDVSQIYFNSESIQNILINLGIADSVKEIRFYNADGSGIKDQDGNTHDVFTIGGGNIIVDIENGSIKIDYSPDSDDDIYPLLLKATGSNGETIEDLRIDIVIEDQFGENSESLALQKYLSIFDQISMYNIAEHINNDYNVKYYSTVEDNKYKIRVINPDSIEIEDKYEAVPLKVLQNNKSIVGGVDIKKKINVDKIGIKVINRYSGFYNPIFNDILYYDDYTYTTNVGRLRNAITYELPYSNTYIDYDYYDNYGEFGVIKNMYYHKTNTTRSDKILTTNNPVYPAINEYALDYRDYNIFSSSWDEGYFISQDDLENRSFCSGIGSMKDGLCMFGSKYLNLPDYIFIDTFENGKVWNDKMVIDDKDDTDIEIVYKEINDKTVKYHLFIEKRLKRYLVEQLYEVFSKYINKDYSFGNKGTIDDDIEEYVEKNLLKLYKVDRIYLYIKEERMQTNNRKIENEYLKHISDNNDRRIKLGFPVINVENGVIMKESKFIMSKPNEFDRDITYNLKNGYKESFGFGVSIRRK